MGSAVERIELGRVQAIVFDQASASWAILLPGAGYTTQAPLLWYARRAALAAGRNVLAITDAFDRGRDDPARWVEEHAEAALSHVRADDAQPLLVAKSITSLAAPLAAARGLPAVWLTPLIAAGSPAAAQVVPGLHAATEPRLIVGGAADPSWDTAVASTLANAEVLELPGADHSLELPDDVAASLENLRRVTVAIDRFVARLA